jgi:murein DD-endopeptidase MepM/ murein hydrolase activator NlpD
LKDVVARTIAYSTVGILAIGALQLTPPLPPQGIPRLAAIEVRPVWMRSADTLADGETLSALLARNGLGGAHALLALRAATGLDVRRVPAGLAINVARLDDDSIPSEVVFELAIDRYLTVTRTDSGWFGHETRLPWTIDTVIVGGTITSNLYAAMDVGAAEVLPEPARAELAGELADIYEYRVDMSRDLQVDDEFRVIFERQSGPRGVVRVGTIIVAAMTLSGTETEAIRFEYAGSSSRYFDQKGKPMRSGFLQAPLQFRRISSTFGGRRHPILKTWRSHNGTDYAANSGTPVRTVGDGTVIFAGTRGGYGRTIEVRHKNGFVTRYAHLRGFARGIHTGARVSIEQTIGYVGMTGLATGPHLHFEVLVNGRHRDPRTALRGQGNADPIPARELARFERLRDAMRVSLDLPDGPVRLAALEQ